MLHRTKYGTKGLFQTSFMNGPFDKYQTKAVLPHISPDDDADGHECADDAEEGDDGEDDALRPEEELGPLRRVQVHAVAVVVVVQDGVPREVHS